MSDIAEMVAWLRREIEADKAAALAIDSGPWRTTDDQDDFDGDILIGYVTLRAEDGTALADDRSGALAEEDLRHVARHDPQDVIADCHAKLQIVRELSTVTLWNWPSQADGSVPMEYVEALRHVLKLLAQGYRHRDGWKDEWTA